MRLDCKVRTCGRRLGSYLNFTLLIGCDRAARLGYGNIYTAFSNACKYGRVYYISVTAVNVFFITLHTPSVKCLTNLNACNAFTAMYLDSEVWII